MLGDMARREGDGGAGTYEGRDGTKDAPPEAIRDRLVTCSVNRSWRSRTGHRKKYGEWSSVSQSSVGVSMG